jgi:hypothetical protein
LIAESNRLETHKTQDTIHEGLRALTVVTTLTEVPTVGMVT